MVIDKKLHVEIFYIGACIITSMVLGIGDRQKDECRTMKEEIPLTLTWCNIQLS